VLRGRVNRMEKLLNDLLEYARIGRAMDNCYAEGSGIGLSMVRKHIEVCGETLHLESAEGRGSTFCFTLPRRQQQRKEVNESAHNTQPSAT
jgi:signal transduction histidine kinase